MSGFPFDSVTDFEASTPARIRQSWETHFAMFSRPFLTLTLGDNEWAWFQNGLRVVTAWESSYSVRLALSEIESAFRDGMNETYLKRLCPGSWPYPKSLAAVEGYTVAAMPCIRGLKEQYTSEAQSVYNSLKRSLDKIDALAAKVVAVREFRQAAGEVGNTWANARGQFLADVAAQQAETVAALGEEVAALSQDVGTLSEVVSVVVDYVEMPPEVKAKLKAEIDGVVAARSRAVASIKSIVDAMVSQAKSLADGTAEVAVTAAPVVPGPAPAAQGGISAPMVLVGAAAAWFVFGRGFK